MWISIVARFLSVVTQNPCGLLSLLSILTCDSVTDIIVKESEPNRGRRFPGFDGRIDGVTAHSRVEIQTLDPVNLQ
jgi:hypothetical protein